MRFFTTREARVLRLVCKEFREAVEATAWNDLETRISGRLGAWRASFPSAIAANLSNRGDLVDGDFALFRGLHGLDVSLEYAYKRDCNGGRGARRLTDAAFVHLRGIRKLILRDRLLPAITSATLGQLARH